MRTCVLPGVEVRVGCRCRTESGGWRERRLKGQSDGLCREYLYFLMFKGNTLVE